MSRTETNARYVDQMTARYGSESWQVELVSLYHHEVCRNVSPGIHRMTPDHAILLPATIVRLVGETANPDAGVSIGTFDQSGLTISNEI